MKEKRQAVEDEADGGGDGDTAQTSILHKDKTSNIHLILLAGMLKQLWTCNVCQSIHILVKISK